MPLLTDAREARNSGNIYTQTRARVHTHTHKHTRWLRGVLRDVLRDTCLIVWGERWVSVTFFLVLFVLGGTTSVQILKSQSSIGIVRL